MTVTFGRTQFVITAPEGSWRFVNGRAWCTACDDSLTFVFLTTQDTGWKAANYQTPKAVRCNCLNADGTKRAPIPLASITQTTKPPGVTAIRPERLMNQI
jgi:hypothetical protein